ncbi:Acetylcholinesterase [Holothuria leucospilota]|uniref:Carboxylic ester hydrolase n=1 Tax=Holothuria leucospilota TaxID=206669 RepID=A0A9Q0YM51_HOLLE|nr:Acetylcholinesterase [Holothuria leucospilota]
MVHAHNVYVTTNNGVVFGEHIPFARDVSPVVNATLDVFKGIPFAVPPIGQMRFRKPLPIPDWSEPWNATYYRKQCWQLFLQNFTDPQDEDCLYLNIWSPDVTGPPKPVMVWIHGGGFVLGTANIGPYDGTVLTSFYDIVYVSINYRLNGFGFLSTGDEELPGNYGLWDQVLALKWIKENIAAFGGDPERITIFGQSAGGASVGFHLVQEESWNYFHRAIMLSGTTMSPWAQETNPANAREDAFLLGRLAGCGVTTTSRELADCLRQVDAYRLTVAITTNNIPLGPVVDGDFFQSDSRSLLNRGHFKKCNVLFSTTADDGTIITARAYPTELLTRFPNSDFETFTAKLGRFMYTYTNDLIVRSIQQQYVDWSKRDAENTNYFNDFVRVSTDEGFLCPAEYTARVYAEANLPVYRALFNHLPKYSTWPDPFVKWRGIAHSEDNPYTFGRGFNPERGHVFTLQEEDLSLNMMQYYTNFAKTGNPNIDLENNTVTSHWEPFTLTNQFVKDLQLDLGDLYGLRASYCAVWNNLIPELITQSGIY